MITKKGFKIKYHGDPTVAIFDKEFTINGDFYFDSIKDLDKFVDQLLSTFELVSDNPLYIEEL